MAQHRCAEHPSSAPVIECSTASIASVDMAATVSYSTTRALTCIGVHLRVPAHLACQSHHVRQSLCGFACHACFVTHAASFTVHSTTTILNVPGASRFQTSLVLTTTERSADGTSATVVQSEEAVCDVTFSVKCGAGMPWYAPCSPVHIHPALPA